MSAPTKRWPTSNDASVPLRPVRARLAWRRRSPSRWESAECPFARVGTTAYLKIAHHAPAIADRDFWPLLVLDAVLTGAKGLNLWTSFRSPPPQRSARLYRTLVDAGLASAVSGAVLPTGDPFLYVLSVTAREGQSLAGLEAATLHQLDRVAAHGITTEELGKARRQLRARLVFDRDSVTNIAHQLGFFHTIARVQTYFDLERSVADVTIDEVARVARERLKPSQRTIGWFEPLPADSGPPVSLESEDVRVTRRLA